jgi:hypothetical protein
MKDILLLISLLLIVLSNSFSKESIEETKTLKIDNLPANSPDRFTLFSFKTGKAVPNTDSLSNKWDIGFKGTTIIVNGGKIRKGQGGISLSPTAFDQIQTLSDTLKFAVDTEESLAIQPGSGNGWYSYNMSTHEILPIRNKTLIIKTGEGRYAKVEILSYYKDRDSANETRYYTFRYNYQPDGSKTF